MSVCAQSAGRLGCHGTFPASFIKLINILYLGLTEGAFLNRFALDDWKIENLSFDGDRTNAGGEKKLLLENDFVG